MAESSDVLCETTRKHISFVLKWFKVTVEVCEVCQKRFLRASKEPSSDEVVIVPISQNSSFTFAQLRDLRNCLPIADDSPLTLAIVAVSGLVSLYSLKLGITQEIHQRPWKPNRTLLENPEKFAEIKAKKVVRQQKRKAPVSEVVIHEVIVIDD